jgi:hypothetical protein
MTLYPSLASVQPTDVREVSAVSDLVVENLLLTGNKGKDLKGDDERTLIDPDVVRDV